LPRTRIAHSEPSGFFPTRLFPLAVSLAFLSLAAPSLRADQTVYSASTQTNPLDNTNEAARSAAMGSAFTGVADDATALFSNPAGLGLLNQGQLFLNSDLWLAGVFQETALAGFPIQGAGGFGLAVHYLSYGQMDGRDELGSLTTTYSADRLGLEAGWGYEFLKNWSLGVELGGEQTTLAGTGYTYLTSNVGLLWRDGRGLRLGASYLNTGWISPGGASEDAVNLGASYQVALDPGNRLLAAVGGSIEPHAVNYLQAGAEYSIRDQVFLRLGCQVPLSDNALGGLTDLTAGVGFHLSGFSLDYAFLPYGDLGAAHRVSVGYFFDNPKPESVLPATSPNPGFTKSIHPAQQENSTSRTTFPKPAGPVEVAGPPTATSTGKNGDATKNTAFTDSDVPPWPPESTLSPAPSATVTGPDAPRSQPQTADADNAKDSLVVQFDLPDNPAPSGAELEKEGKYFEAVAAYVAALKQNPGDASSWWALGNCYREIHRKTYAIQCFEQVLKLQPENKKLADWLEQYKLSDP